MRTGLAFGLFLASLCALPAQRQSDSAVYVLVYGPETTGSFQEDDLLEFRKPTSWLDTSLTDFHLYDPAFRMQADPLQDLGNLGSPSRHIFYRPPSQVGTGLGFSAFDPWAWNSDDVRYFDTKSPHTSLYYVQGGLGQQILDARFTVNPTPDVNFGVDFRRSTSNPQLGQPLATDQYASHYGFKAWLAARSKRGNYRLLLNFTTLNHIVNESGGIRPDSNEAFSKNNLFDYQEEQVWLSNVQRYDWRYQYHVYQQLSVFDSTVQLYHRADYHLRVNRYIDRDLQGNRDFYADRGVFIEPFVNDTIGGVPVQVYNYFPAESLHEFQNYQLIQNEAGIKGGDSLKAYRAWVRRIDFTWDGSIVAQNQEFWRAQNFIGGYLRAGLRSGVGVEGEGEVSDQGDLLLRGDLWVKVLRGGIHFARKSPDLLENHYSGRFLAWDNDFLQTTSLRVHACADVPLTENLKVNVGFANNTVSDLVYYGPDGLPRQEGQAVNQLSAFVGGRWVWQPAHLYVEHQTRYTASSGPDVLPAPKWHIRQRTYWAGKVIGGRLPLSLGLDVSFLSSYYAPDYLPLTGQFLVQDEFESDGYVIVEPFVNARIKHAMLFFKMSHMSQGFFGRRGYFTTPYYTGQPRSFEFGIRWDFYD